MDLPSGTESEIVKGIKKKNDSPDCKVETLLREGSEDLKNNLPQEATAKYKSALSIIEDKTQKEITGLELVLRYALCVAWVRCGDFRDILRSIDYLTQLDISGYAVELPAVYLCLGQAYRTLNRFKAALLPINKGLKFLENIDSLKVFCWPGSTDPIKETNKKSLQAALLTLQKDCRVYRTPDGICRYEKCLSVSDHILPSKNIYFSDPDFVPFVVIQCESKCKIVYHDSCWKHIKHEKPDVEKCKDFLGMNCPTIDCMITDAEGNTRPSVLVEVSTIGKDGYDNPLKIWNEDNVRKHNANTGSTKKKYKPDKTVDKYTFSEATNGCTDKGKSKVSRNKEKKPATEQSVSTSLPPVCSAADTSSEDKLMQCMQLLNKIRKLKFGFGDKDYLNPELQYYGHSDIQEAKFLDDDAVPIESKSLIPSMEFVFSFYHSLMDSNGPLKIEELENRWKNDQEELGLNQTFIEKYPRVSKLLLQSRKFAAIDDLIGTSDFLPDMYSKVEKDLTETISFLLFKKVVKPQSKEEEKPYSQPVGFNPWSFTPNNLNFNSPPAELDGKINQVRLDYGNDICLPFSLGEGYSHSGILFSESEDDDDESDEDGDGDTTDDSAALHENRNEEQINGNSPLREKEIKLWLGKEMLCKSDMKDSNENPIFGKGLKEENGVFGRSNLKPTSQPFVPPFVSTVELNHTQRDSQPIYLSDDDKDDDTDIEVRCGVAQYINDDYSDLLPGAVYLNESNVRPLCRWSDGNDLPMINTINKETQTEINLLETDLENTKMLNLTLKYEKDELQQKIKSLHTQLENIRDLQVKEASRAQQEVQQSKIAKQTQDKIQQKQESKIKDLEVKLAEALRVAKNFETLSKNHEAEMDKLRIAHSKEFFRITKENEEKDRQLKALKETLKDKEQIISRTEKDLLHLWKKHADNIFTLYNRRANDRICIMDSLKHMMSDNEYPKKSDIDAAIRKCEHSMRDVVEKTKDINECFIKEKERWTQGSRLNPLKPLNIDELMDLPNPIEDALDYLKKCKVPEKMLRSRLPYSPANSSDLFSGPKQLLNSGIFNGSNTMLSSSAFEPEPSERQHTLPDFFQPEKSVSQQTPLMPSTSAPHIWQMGGYTGFNSSMSPLIPLPPSQLMQQTSSSLIGSIQPSSIRSASPPVSAKSPSPSPTINGSASFASATGPIPMPPSPTKSLTSSLQGSKSTNTLGAIPKVRLGQTATAALTPILPCSKIASRPAVKATTIKVAETNSQKLMLKLQTMFPTRTEAELMQAYKFAREKNNNTLSSLTYSEIVTKVEDVLQKNFKKHSGMGLEKFGHVAWGTAKVIPVDWEGTVEEECSICTDPMKDRAVYSLQCKHAFHELCIRQWLSKNSVCPNCRKHSTMQDEFPPLG